MSEKATVEELEFIDIHEEDVDYIISQSITDPKLVKQFIKNNVFNPHFNGKQISMYVEWKGLIVGLISVGIVPVKNSNLTDVFTGDYAVITGVVYPEYRRKGVMRASFIKLTEIIKNDYNINEILFVSISDILDSAIMNIKDDVSAKILKHEDYDILPKYTVFALKLM